jgi:hypothetical protein
MHDDEGQIRCSKCRILILGDDVVVGCYVRTSHKSE